MRKLIPLAFTLATFLIISCSGDEAYSGELDDRTAIEEPISEEELFYGENQNSSDGTSCDNIFPAPNSSIVPYTVTGYSSHTNANYKATIIRSEMASKIGIPSGTYIMANFTVYRNITITGLGTTQYFVPANSPNCGMDPADRFNIGYSNSQNGEIVTLTTNVYHIASDAGGASYDIWYPCPLEQLEWNYQLITL
ncbi:MAG: hypothetical protein NC344_05055 [Bacteroidales bacterium]|nr:hypothetical protein [Bacteroidales bacterium]MCM1147195.1 hypothetical protein [Bacteroidales bacterium]MCM1205421.1 hypothetical protein [Bacillota bacterium]MCM1509774.1 hypothetical protein [Clostridium sp.]